jgi:hypothetical protein
MMSKWFDMKCVRLTAPLSRLVCSEKLVYQAQAGCHVPRKASVMHSKRGARGLKITLPEGLDLIKGMNWRHKLEKHLFSQRMAA